jgi:hypothetical protein
MLVLALIVALAATVRLWRLTHLELSHWDEGAYTLGAEWLASGGQAGKAMSPYYAPPLFPVAVAGSFLVFGVSAPMAVLVSALFGAAGVAAQYALVRRVWGPAAGLAAALLLATCDYHIIYSRMALTDSTFSFFVLVALAASVRALATGTRRAWAVVGVTAGLAQNTKYHGLAVLAVVTVYSALAGIARHRRRSAGPSPAAGENGVRPQRKDVKGSAPVFAGGGKAFGHSVSGGSARRWPGLLLAWAVAGALCLPWAALIQSRLGLGAFIAHLRSFSGFGLTSVETLAAYALRFTAPTVLVLAGVGVLVALLRPVAEPLGQTPTKRRQGVSPHGSATGLVLLALAAFALAPTMYQGYPRLLLPAIALACGFGGVGLAWLFGMVQRGAGGQVETVSREGNSSLFRERRRKRGQSPNVDERRKERQSRAFRTAGLVLLVGFVGFDGLRRSLPTVLRSPAGYAEAAATLNALPPDARLSVCAQYCLDFYLTRPVTRLSTDDEAEAFLAPQPVERYLAVDLRALRHRRGDFLPYLAALDQQGRFVRTVWNPLPDAVLLDTLSRAEVDVLGPERDRAAFRPLSTLGRRALEIVIYRIPAGWGPTVSSQRSGVGMLKTDR